LRAEVSTASQRRGTHRASAQRRDATDETLHATRPRADGVHGGPPSPKTLHQVVEPTSALQLLEDDVDGVILRRGTTQPVAGAHQWDGRPPGRSVTRLALKGPLSGPCYCWRS
jgi:hypothetical protein